MREGMQIGAKDEKVRSEFEIKSCSGNQDGMEGSACHRDVKKSSIKRDGYGIDWRGEESKIYAEDPSEETER